MANNRSIGSVLLVGIALLAPACGGSGGGGGVPGPLPGVARWYSQYRRPTSSNLRAVRAANANSIIVAGEATSIHRSDDGGVTWVQLEHIPFGRGGDILSMDFYGTHLVTAGIDSKDTTKGRVWTAVNGVLDFVTPDLDAVVVPYRCVDVVSSDTSYLLRSDGVVEKNVGGVVTSLAPLPGGTWNGIDFFGTTDTGFAVGDSYRIFRHTSGTGWTQMTTPATFTHTLQRVHFPTLSVGYACGDNASALVTIDGGLNWTLLSPQPPDAPDPRVGRGLHFPVNGDTGWFVGDMGMIAKLTVTYPGGIPTYTFTPQFSTTTEDLYDVFFADNLVGYAVGNHGIVVKTIDGGANWLRAPPMSVPDTLTQLNAVDFSNDGSRGIVVGNGGLILRTLNGGTSWEQINAGVPVVDLYGAAIPKVGGVDVAYACGAGGTILRTGNLQAASPAWVVQTVGASAWRAILFPSGDNVGYVAGDGATLRRTTNGTTWLLPSIVPAAGVTPTNWLALSSDLGGLNLYAAGTEGRLWLSSSSLGDVWANQPPPVGTGFTINSFQSPPGAGTLFAGTSDGNVWRNISGFWFSTTPPAGIPQSMSFADTSNGWIVNSPAPFTGGMFYTEDGGTNWLRSYVHTKWQLRGVWASPLVQGLVYAVGDQGTILKSITGGK